MAVDGEYRLGFGSAPDPADGATKREVEAHLEARRIMVEKHDLAGLSQRKIAELVGVHVSQVHRDLQVIRRQRREAFGASTVIEQRDVTLARLEEERAHVLECAGRGEAGVRPKDSLTQWQASRLILQIEKQRAELLGLNVPTKVALAEIPVGEEDTSGLAEAEKPVTLRDFLATTGIEASSANVAKALHMHLSGGVPSGDS
jgi:transposase